LRIDPHRFNARLAAKELALLNADPTRISLSDFSAP
jgi:hypothetical protein